MQAELTRNHLLKSFNSFCQYLKFTFSCLERSPWYSFRLMLVTISLVAFSSRFESRQRLSALSITCSWLSNKRSDQINVQRANFRNWLTFTDWCFKWISRQPKLVFFQTMSFFLRLFESEDDVNATKVWKIMRMQFPPNKSKSSKVVTYFVANHLATIFSSLEIGLPRLSWDFCVKKWLPAKFACLPLPLYILLY